MHDVLAHARKAGCAGKAASEPPAMIDRVPAMAPTSPPETGASIKSTPATAKSSPIWRAAAGAMVLMSTATRPGSAALATAHDLGHVGRIGHHGNDQFVTACRVSRTGAMAPASSKGCIDSARRAQTVTVWPPLMRLCAIGRPMMPRPINPIFMLNSASRRLGF
jgi:hypothetical protein